MTGGGIMALGQDSLPAAVRAVQQNIELRSLEVEEQRLTERLARRVRDTLYPHWEQSMLLTAVARQEQKARASLLHNEAARFRANLAVEHRELCVLREVAQRSFQPLFGAIEEHTTLDDVRMRYSKTLKAYYNKLLQKMEAREIGLAQDRLRQMRRLRLQGVTAPPLHFPELAEESGRVALEKEERDSRTKLSAEQLMETYSVRQSADKQKCEVEKKKEEKAIAEGPKRMVAGTLPLGMHRFELVQSPAAGCSLWLEWHGHRQQVARIQYDNGVLRCHGIWMPVPPKDRERICGTVATWAAAAKVPHDIPGVLTEAVRVQLPSGVGEGEDERGTEGPAGLLEYAVLYECPKLSSADEEGKLFRRDNTTPTDLAQKLDRIMPLSTRAVLARALPFLDEVGLQCVRAVSREVRSLVEEPRFVAERRFASQATLRRCGVKFEELPAGDFRLGPPASWAREDCGPVTFRGFGDSSAEHTATTTYRQGAGQLVSSEPITVRQWQRIARAFPHVAHLVREEDLLLCNFNLVNPSMARNARLVQRDLVETSVRWFSGRWQPPPRGKADPGMYLELPWETVTKIAAALGATVPTWQEWEVGTRGFEGREFSWAAAKAEETDMGLSRHPFAWPVPNPRFGQRADNGYVELAPTSVAVHAVHRVHEFPKDDSSRALGSLPPPDDTASVYSGTGTVVSPRWAERRGDIYRLYLVKRHTEGKGPDTELPRLLEVKVAPTAESPVLRRLVFDSMDPTARQPEVCAQERMNWLRLADGSGWIRMQGGLYAWKKYVKQLEHHPPPLTPTAGQRRPTLQLPASASRGRLRGVASRMSSAGMMKGRRSRDLGGIVDQLRSARRRESESASIVVSPLGGLKSRRAGQRQVSWFGTKKGGAAVGPIARRLSFPEAGPQQQSPPVSPRSPRGKDGTGPTPLVSPRKSPFSDGASAEPVLRGVARLGKEWNLCCGDCFLMQSGATAFDRVLRSASDLFSVQDINQHVVSLPRDFYATNHRAFSGPPLWCLAPEPKCLPLLERKRILGSDVEAEFETFGVPRSQPGQAGRQIRAKRRMTRVPINVSVVAGQLNSLCVAPVRAAFRLSFAPGGAPQPNPCRPVARSCDKCTREYYWQEECPRCSAVASALRRYTITSEVPDIDDADGTNTSFRGGASASASASLRSSTTASLGSFSSLMASHGLHS
eukprot:Hpha_TRINITY_DN33853_c0_g1::TRINITY_DN33853_c0_g1_i1::g.27444::m.27444